MREWSDELLDAPDHPEWSIKFQGDVEFVQTPRAAAAAAAAAEDRRAARGAPASLATKVICRNVFFIRLLG